MGNSRSATKQSDAEEQLLNSSQQQANFEEIYSRDCDGSFFTDIESREGSLSESLDIPADASIDEKLAAVQQQQQKHRLRRNQQRSQQQQQQQQQTSSDEPQVAVQSGCCCCYGKRTFHKLAKSESELQTTSAAAAEDSVKHSSLARIVSLSRPELCRLLFATLFLIVGTCCVLLQPLFFGRIIQISQSDNSNKQQQLNRAAFVLLVILCIGAVANSIRGWQYTLAGERLVRRLRRDLFAKIVQQDVSFYDENKTGELMNRLSSDTAVIQSALSVNISMGLRAVAELLVSVALLFVTSWRLAAVMMVVVPLLMLLVVIYGGFTKQLTKSYQDALAAAADCGSESIGNARIMKSFGAEDLETNRYHEKVDLSYRKGALKALAYGVFAGMVGFLSGLAILVVIYYGALLVMSGDMNVGSLTAFVFYTLYIAIDMAVLSGLYTEFMNAVGAGERIFRLLDTDPKIPTKGGLWPTHCHGHIEFDNIDFTYPTRQDAKILDAFSLSVRPNQTVALVGASGSGKSTVLCLLERFYDCSSGSVKIDGCDIRDIDPRWLHRNIAIVPQEPVLFSGTIFSNIAYSRAAADPSGAGPLATMEEVIIAGKQANAHDFIMGFPEGYETLVGERGIRLSGGQKQRVAIARALLANPRILLLDEATSALDAESEMLVQDAITRLMRNRTVMIIAHRLSTVRDADVIAVFGKGSVESTGTHSELLRKSAVYANLVKKQLSGAESAATATISTTAIVTPTATATAVAFATDSRD